MLRFFFHARVLVLWISMGCWGLLTLSGPGFGGDSELPRLYLLSDFHEDRGQVPERVGIIRKSARSQDILLLEGLLFDPEKPVFSGQDEHVRLLTKGPSPMIRTYGWEDRESFQNAVRAQHEFYRALADYGEENPWFRELFSPQFDGIQEETGEIFLRIPLPKHLYELCQKNYYGKMIGERNKSLSRLLIKMAENLGKGQSVFVVLGKAHINEDLINKLKDSYKILIPVIPPTIRQLVMTYELIEASGI